VNSPRGDLDEEQYVERLQEHRLDREEVCGQDSPALCSQKLGPGRTGATRCRSQAGPTQYAPDGACSDPDPQLAELAPGSARTPTGGSPGPGAGSDQRFRDRAEVDRGLAGDRSTCALRAGGAIAAASAA
jgi:hypothetical protein